SAAMALSVMVLQEAYRPVDGSQEDGLLTAAELQRLDLRGTAMLVLSQCQMASGVPSVGEGVYGMRRAAAIAGAQTFVAPLWNVEDRVQRGLMREFYRNVVAGQNRATALRRAKLTVKSRAPTHSFLYWAPVILSGDIAPLALTPLSRPTVASGPNRRIAIGNPPANSSH
ncbi:MAG: CHAT domain-containing protein, partial [Acidobacteriota bacterium]